MTISATMVKDLREKTSAGMLDCKKALEETKGDFEAAVEWLRKKGLASASKKADRLASEGLIGALVRDLGDCQCGSRKGDGQIGVLLEINSETDFVAQNEVFRHFAGSVLDRAVSMVKHKVLHKTEETSPASDEGDILQALLNFPLSKGEGTTIQEALQGAIAKIGENLVLRRCVYRKTNGYLHSYVHGDGKIGVLVEVDTQGQPFTESVKVLAHDLCLHVAAMSPLSVSSDEISPSIIEKEREIFRAKNLEQGKKPEMIDRIVEGQIKKFMAESSLLEQSFVKNPDLKVKDYVTQKAGEAGIPLSVKSFLRFELGEGLKSSGGALCP